MKNSIFFTLLLLVSFCGLPLSLPAQADSKAKPAAAPVVSLMGTLERRIAIGGETTGWVLRHGEKQRVELLLPIEAFAWIAEGLVVSVSGTHGKKTYPERGEVAVFVVQKISQVVN
ncbi:MAG TPA: hypothetical protein DDZ88_11185 [Verrucomicrobiales bacterium]|nr:hypothetical protein [Verrucomicrobiales bacterium]